MGKGGAFEGEEERTSTHVDANVSGGLQATVALVAEDGLVVHVVGGDGDGGAADAEAEGGQVRVAVEDPATVNEGVLNRVASMVSKRFALAPPRVGGGMGILTVAPLTSA